MTYCAPSAATPRFAVTSSQARLESAGRLAAEHPDAFVHSHVAENPAEVKWARDLYPQARSYLDIYDRFGLLRERAVYAHGIHLDDEDRRRMAQLRGHRLTPWRAFYLATLGGAVALGLDDRIGSFAPGREADFVVLRMDSTPLIARRMKTARTPGKKLFALMSLGDDREIGATYVMGDRVWNSLL